LNILTLDFETYFDSDYSLLKMTNEEYIRDEKFEPIMVGLKMNSNETFWVPAPEIPRVFKMIPWGEVAVLCHHAQFDVAILSWVYDVHPAFILDTIPMFRCLYPAEAASLSNVAKVLGLQEKGFEVLATKGKHFKDFNAEDLTRFGSYCIGDVDITYQAFNIMKTQIPLSELRLNDLVCRMFTEPIFMLDETLLIEAHKDEIIKKQALLDKIGSDKKTLGSNQLFAELLLKLGYDPPKKVSPAWKKKNEDEVVEDEFPGLIPEGYKGPWTYAFAKSDEFVKNGLEGEDETLKALLEARVGTKSSIRETRMARMINVSRRGTLPVYLKVWGAHTGRFGGGDLINLQNLTRSCDAEGCEGGEIG
jgi:hypothetical protein